MILGLDRLVARGNGGFVLGAYTIGGMTDHAATRTSFRSGTMLERAVPWSSSSPEEEKPEKEKDGDRYADVPKCSAGQHLVSPGSTRHLHTQAGAIGPTQSGHLTSFSRESADIFPAFRRTTANNAIARPTLMIVHVQRSFMDGLLYSQARSTAARRPTCPSR